MIDDGMLLCAWVGRWLGLLAMGSILQEIQSRLNQSTGTTVSHFLKIAMPSRKKPKSTAKAPLANLASGGIQAKVKGRILRDSVPVRF